VRRTGATGERRLFVLTPSSSLGYNVDCRLRGEPVKIDIRPIMETKGATLPLAFAQVLDDVQDPGCVVRFKGPVNVSGQLTNTGDCIMLTGDARVTVEMLCDRCVEPFECLVETKLEYGYVDAGRFQSLSGRRAGRAGGAKETDEELDFRRFEDEEIDVTAEIREAVLLALPGKRLCSPECKGICPNCGTNLNKSECRCSEQPVDPRLADLSRLLSE